MKIMHMLGILVLVAVLALLALGGVGYSAQQGLLRSVAAQLTSSDALRNHMQADMMHDALRGDVTAALLAAARQDADGVKAARASLGEHSRRISQGAGRQPPSAAGQRLARATGCRRACAAALQSPPPTRW